MLGYAFLGKAHVNAYRTLPYMIQPPPALPRLEAIAGRDAVAVREAAERYGFRKSYTDWRQLVADPAVALLDNGGPNDVHAAPCIAGAKAGKHLLCEKPLARDGAEAKQMLAAASRAHVKHMVAFNYRFVPAVRQAYELIRAGELGEIRHFRAHYLQDWITDPEFPRVWRLDRTAAGSGALGDLGAHVVDLARFLVGELKSVAALTRTFIKERPLPTASKVPRGARAAAGGKRAPVDVDDTLPAAIELEGGATGTLEATGLALGRKNHEGSELHRSRAPGGGRTLREPRSELEEDGLPFALEADVEAQVPSVGLGDQGYPPARLDLAQDPVRCICDPLVREVDPRHQMP